MAGRGRSRKIRKGWVVTDACKAGSLGYIKLLFACRSSNEIIMYVLHGVDPSSAPPHF